jgi:hypothetical protein
MHRIRVSLGPYGYWLKRRDEDDPEMIPDTLEKGRCSGAIPAGKGGKALRRGLSAGRLAVLTAAVLAISATAGRTDNLDYASSRGLGGSSGRYPGAPRISPRLAHAPLRAGLGRRLVGVVAVLGASVECST